MHKPNSLNRKYDEPKPIRDERLKWNTGHVFSECAPSTKSLFGSRRGFSKEVKKSLDTQGTFFVGLTNSSFEAILVDRTQRRGRNLQRDPLTRRRNEKTLLLQVRKKLTLRFIIGVRNVISYAGSFSGNLTNLSHDLSILQMRVQI